MNQHGGTGTISSGGTKKKYLFSKEIKMLMYGFGDSYNPRQDSIELAEDMIVDYLTDLVISFVINIDFYCSCSKLIKCQSSINSMAN